MPDVFTPGKRKEVMRLIKSKNSKAELLTFKYLRGRKIYFQKHYRKAPGSPDIALPRKKKACFIDGDFWHGRRLNNLVEKRGLEDYWTLKIINNIERDHKQRTELYERGWKILTIWESDLLRKSTRNQALYAIERFLLSDNS
jgi:DNA mismatch endonuclease, patch repair protein